MKDRAQETEDAFRQGYNCCQSVVVAFADRIGMEKDAAAKLVSGFGGGFSRLREVCGAVSGMVFIANALCGYCRPDDPVGKAAHYALIQKLAKEFRSRAGSIICRDILGLPEGAEEPPLPEARTDAYYQKRPCPQMVRLAAEILEREFPEK